MAEWIIWTDEADHPLKLEIKPPGNITKLKTHHPVLLPNDPREQILVLTQIAAGMGVKITALETPEWVPDIGDKVVAGASRGEITAVGRTFALILWQGRSEEEGKVKREVLRLDHEFYGQDLVQALPDEQLPIDPRGGGGMVVLTLVLFPSWMKLTRRRLLLGST